VTQRKKRTAAEEQEIKARLKDEHLLETFPDDALDSFEQRTAAVTHNALAARARFVARLQAVDPSLVEDFREFLNVALGPISELHAEHIADVRALRGERDAASRKQSTTAPKSLSKRKRS